MAIKKTLAQNHLSDLARQGRGGDTELAHVNPREKSMLKAMGGSGTINPNTGLREYFDPLTAISLGVSLFGGISRASDARGHARDQMRLSQSTIDEASEAIGALEPKKEAETEIAMGEYQTGAESLGVGKEQADKQLSEQVRKSGLVTSAGITEKKSDVWKQFGTAAKGLYGKLGKTLGGIEEWFEGEKSRLEGVIKQAGFQKAAAARASKKKFLGIF